MPLCFFALRRAGCGSVSGSVPGCGQSCRLPSGFPGPELFRTAAAVLVRPAAVMLYDSIGDFVHFIPRSLREGANLLIRHLCDADRSRKIAAARAWY